jgi:hypothetical protein
MSSVSALIGEERPRKKVRKGTFSCWECMIQPHCVTLEARISLKEQANVEKFAVSSDQKAMQLVLDAVAVALNAIVKICP